MLIALPFIFSTQLPSLSHLNAPFLVYFISGTYLLGCFILSVVALLDSTNLQDTKTFLEKLKKADQEYQAHVEN